MLVPATRRLAFLSAVALAFVFIMLASAGRAAAAAPDHVSFTLQGCRPSSPTVTPGVCPNNGDFTTGNLGKSWNELDLVPHRLTASAGADNSSGYTVLISADYLDGNCPFLTNGVDQPLLDVTAAQIAAGCIPGYDRISVPTVNTSLSSNSGADCTVSASDQLIEVPGQGGMEATIYRKLTIHQPNGSTCVFDWYQRLALGSHLFPGSALHSNLLNESFSTAGIGSKEVSIPVKEISPQTISKTMTATQGVSNIWDVQKSADTANVNFPDVCDPQASHDATVHITVTWTKTTNASGDILVHMVISATNPAARPLTIHIADSLYKGTDTSDPNPRTFGTPAAGVTLDPGTHVVLTHDETYTAGSATDFTNVPVATYDDPVLNQPIPGTVRLDTPDHAVHATVVAGGGAANDSAIVKDSESISGTNLQFKVTAHTTGSYDPAYTEGTLTTGPVAWNSGTVSSSGSVTFTKVIHVNGSDTTSGTLTDTAQVYATNGTTAISDPFKLDIPITATGCASVSGHKYNDLNANGTQDPGEPGLSGWTFYVDYNGNDTLDQGEPFATSDANGDWTITGVKPGSFDVKEVGQAGWTCSEPSGGCLYNEDFAGVALPGSLVFGNWTTASVSGVKFNDANGNGVRNAGEGGLAGWTFYVDYNGNGSLDPGEPSAVSGSDGSYTITGVKPGTFNVREVGQPGWSCTFPSGCAYSTLFQSNQAVTGRDFGNFLPAPVQQVLGQQVVPGEAHIAGATGCVARKFKVRVSGKQIDHVVFKIDGRRVATVRKANASGQYVITVDPRKFNAGSHLVTAQSVFKSASGTAPKTLKLRFARCVKRRAPAFTG